MSNVFKTGVLLAVLTAMLVLIGGAIGGRQGMGVAFFLALVMNFFCYWFFYRFVPPIYQAQPVAEEGGMNPIATIAMAILAPIAAMLVQMAVSRAREYQADATGARLAGKPWGLAKALEKLQMAQEAMPMQANPATAHLFIVNPLSGQALMTLFSTHPPLEERIARLRAMRP